VPAARPLSTTPAATAKAGRSYTVKSGDSLAAIARKHGVKLTALRQANGLRQDKIKPGQVLVIP
ncbi:MAG: LysM peptidoglycan-binding domain-containing protein, partial [Pseudomonadota bacterium]